MHSLAPGTSLQQLIPLLSLHQIIHWSTKLCTCILSLTQRQRKLNYQLSSDRIVTELAFGHLQGKWQCLQKRNDTSQQYLVQVVAACYIVHSVWVLGAETRATKAIVEFVRGQDVFVSLPTSYGKSLKYRLLPIVVEHLLQKPKQCSVAISPLLSLLIDQKDRFISRGISAEFIGEMQHDDLAMKRIRTASIYEENCFLQGMARPTLQYRYEEACNRCLPWMPAIHDTDFTARLT